MRQVKLSRHPISVGTMPELDCYKNCEKHYSCQRLRFYTCLINYFIQKERKQKTLNVKFLQQENQNNNMKSDVIETLHETMSCCRFLLWANPDR